jgi:hypothetical protein
MLLKCDQTAMERISAGEYLALEDMVCLVRDGDALRRLVDEHSERMRKAPGSSRNHQAWEGGYLDHVREAMNIACQLYYWLDSLRALPFSLGDALTVMFLHDLEKPWKHGDSCLCGHAREAHTTGDALFGPTCVPCAEAGKRCDLYRCTEMATKESRRLFRNRMIEAYGIKLSDAQSNALRYVEGVPDSEYTPGERTMGELAAFCHCCDILSARLWHDRGKNVPSPAWE